MSNIIASSNNPQLVHDLQVNRPARRWSFSALWMPIALLECYLITTVLIFFFGPVDWDIPNVPKLVAFLFVNYLGLWLGYRWGIRRGRRLAFVDNDVRIGELVVSPFVLKVVTFAMFFSIFSNTMRLVAIRGGFGEVLASILNPGEAYLQAQLLAQMDRDGLPSPVQSFSLVYNVSTIFAVFNSLYLPLAVLCWRQLSTKLRVLFLVAVVCTLIFALGTGAQSGIGFHVFGLLPVALYKMYVSRKSAKNAAARQLSDQQRRISDKKRARRTAVLVILSLLLTASTVVFFQLDRAETIEANLDSGDFLVGSFGAPSNNPLFAFEDERVGFGVTMMLKYVSHGYEGLALSMELPFEWTYGLGWSKALQVILYEYLGGPDVFQQSYLVRNDMQNGWPALAWWSTIFPWIASDTTFFGTVFFTLLTGFLIGRFWMTAAVEGEPLAFPVLAQMFTLVFMIPANNAVAQTLDGFFSLLGAFVLYGVSRRFHRLHDVRDGRRTHHRPLSNMDATTIPGS